MGNRKCFRPLVKNPNKFGAGDPDFSHAPLPAITEPNTNYSFAGAAWPAYKHRHTRPGQKARLPARRSRPMTIEKERAHYNAGRVSCWPFLPCRLIPTALAGARRQISTERSRRCPLNRYVAFHRLVRGDLLPIRDGSVWTHGLSVQQATTASVVIFPVVFAAFSSYAFWREERHKRQWRERNEGKSPVAPD